MSRTDDLDRRAGLTLAELMIALIIGGMTLVITAQAASNVRRWTNRLGQAETENTRTVGLYQFMENILSSVLPMTRMVDEKRLALFEGSENSVRFVRVEPGYPSRAGIYQYHLFNTKTPDGLWSLNLEREMLTDTAQFSEPKAPARLVLYSDAKAVTFSFAGAAGWQSDWIGKETPPKLVKLGIADWPALNIALPQAIKKAEAETKDEEKPKQDEATRESNNQTAKAGQ